MAEQTDVNGLKEFENKTEESTNSYGEETVSIEILEEINVVQITS